MGHALGTTIEDIFTRWRRMAAYNAMWLPGIDHAGIATQMVVERELRETEKKSRHDIGREAFVERVWEWRRTTGDRILEQLKRIGLLARLGAHDLHDGPAVFGGGRRGVRAPARGRAHLPRRAGSSTGARRAARRSRTWRSTTTRGRRASCTSSPTRWRTVRARWWWPPRVPRRCSATRRSPCTPTIRATRRRLARS